MPEEIVNIGGVVTMTGCAVGDHPVVVIVADTADQGEEGDGDDRH